MSSPRVSIGLPVYNGAKYLSEAIESVRAQTFADFELVISDNASTDATEEVCRDFAARDERIRYVRAAVNGGAPWNFNRAFELAEGEYFKWLAHDDVIGPRYLESTVEVLDAEPALVLCHSKTAIIDSEGEVITDRGARELESWKLQGITRELERNRQANAHSAWAHRRYLGVLLYSIRNHEVFGVIRRSAMAKTHLHQSYVGGEKAFLAELSLLGPFDDVPEVLAFSRWHPERFSSNASAKAQHAHMNPKARVKLPRQFRSTWGYFRAIVGSELGLRDRAACALVLGRFLLQAGKWKSVVTDYLGGVGQLVKVADASDAEQTATGQHWTSICEAYSRETV